MNKTPSGGEPVISERVKLNGLYVSATLTSDGQLLWLGRSLEFDKDVLGFTIENSKIKIKAIFENGVGICSGGIKDIPVRKIFILEPLTDDSLVRWSQRLQHCMNSLGRPKRLVIFVNPFGGKKSAPKIFFHEVKPLFDDAHIDYTVKETKHQGHAKEVAHTLDLSNYDGIVCVSGDGILVEVVNGLLEREDWETAIRMPLGVIPAGTGNGVAKSLLDSVGEPCSPSYATLAILRGHTRSLDVATIFQGDIKYFSVLMLAWGFVADVDIESEKYRWMGSTRFDFYALQRMYRLRKYAGRIAFAPAPGYEAYGEPILNEERFLDEIDSIQKVDKKCICYQGPSYNMKQLNWREIDGPFVLIWLHNVPWGAENTKAAPEAKFSDGYLDLIMIKECPKLALLGLMTQLNKGGHVKSPYVNYIKVKAFILEPGLRSTDPTEEGIIDVDGEVLARGKGTYKCGEKTLMSYGALHIKVDQGLATLFTPI